MPKDSLSSVVQYLHRIVDGAEPSDAELLARFVGLHDEEAFGLLVWRHGPLVLGLCQRLLRHEQDSEDVFQATFLTLARKAGSIGKKDSLASWLYKVAFHAACRQRAKAGMLTNQAASLEDKPAPQLEADVIWRDLRGVLDQEVALLPEAHGRAIILCYFEGKTHEEAAQLLGCPKGALTTQLSRARERLRQRLTQRGLTLSVAMLGTVMAEKALASAIPAELVHTTARGALAFVSGNTAAGMLSANAVVLAEGVLQMMWYSKLKMAAIVLLAVILMGAGVGWAVRGALADDGIEQVEAQPKAKVDLPGDPKADYAALRAEVAKLRLELDAARKEIKSLKEGKQNAAPKQREDLYRGKPLSFYLEKMKDRDPGFRSEAIQVIGVFAENDKGLIPILIAALKDEGFYMVGTGKERHSSRVGDDALSALREVGPAGIPAAIDALKDNANPDAQARIARYLWEFGPKANAAVPALSKALRDRLANPMQNDWEMRVAVIEAMGSIGPDAKSAIPIIADAFEPAMLSLEVSAKKQNTDVLEFLCNRVNIPANVIVALRRIDPKIKSQLPSLVDLGIPNELSPNENKQKSRIRSRAEYEASWRKAGEMVKKLGTRK